jgi:hypothetical protein
MIANDYIPPDIKRVLLVARQRPYDTVCVFTTRNPIIVYAYSLVVGSARRRDFRRSQVAQLAYIGLQRYTSPFVGTLDPGERLSRASIRNVVGHARASDAD